MDTVRNAVKILSSTSDSIIFLYLGMAMYSKLVFDWWFICWSLLICFVARFIGTFLLTLLVNCLRQDIKPISFQEQVNIVNISVCHPITHVVNIANVVNMLSTVKVT